MPAAALGVSALLVSGFGNKLLSGMFSTPAARAVGRIGVALGVGYALWKMKQRKAAGVVVTAGVAGSVMELTAQYAGPSIDSVLAKVPSIKSLTGGTTGVSGVGQRYLPSPRRSSDPIFAKPF